MRKKNEKAEWKALKLIIQVIDLYFYHFIISFALFLFDQGNKEKDEYAQHGILQLWKCGLTTAVSEAQ